ncbi:MAG TPA: class I adenylate-forming enzyme family protein [Casimicrobiaceae bacterium]|jgi:acyl-CoA synthetase (AMP-forming)/AMP-acid ligase II
MLRPRLTDLIAESAARYGDRPALREADRVVSHAGLASTVDGAAQSLAALGLRPRDRALVVGENAIETLVLALAIGRLGAWPVLATARLATGEIDAIAAHCDPRLALYVPRNSAAAADHATRRLARMTDLAPLGAIGVERFAGERVPDPSPVDVAVMLYTSGTTGAPKAAMLTHENLLFLARAQSVARRYRSDDRVYLALPLAFAGALASITLTTLCAGGCLYVYPRFEPAELARALRDDGLTVLPGVPALYVKLADWARDHPREFAAPHVRLATCASSPMSPALKERVEALLRLPLQNGYGLTETTAVVCQSAIDEPRSDTAAGRPLPGVRVRIVDDAGAEVACGDVGEIVVRGPNVFAGYFRNSTATRAAFTDDGWFRTGDLGRFDEDGVLHLAGRIKDVIKRSGYTVHATDVEVALHAHPAVAQCAVVGRAHGADEQIVAFVQLRERVDAGALAAFLAARLAAHKRPASYRFVDALPMTASGKVDRAALRRLA